MLGKEVERLVFYLYIVYPVKAGSVRIFNCFLNMLNIDAQLFRANRWEYIFMTQLLEDYLTSLIRDLSFDKIDMARKLCWKSFSPDSVYKRTLGYAKADKKFCQVI